MYPLRRNPVADLNTGAVEGSKKRIGKDWGGNGCTDPYCTEPGHAIEFAENPDWPDTMKGVIAGPVDRSLIW